MFVDTGLLHSGATESHRAGRHAQDAADHLSRGPLLAGMFGDFAAAEAFHDAVSVTHADPVTGLPSHQETPPAIGGQAQRAAVEFTDMEEHNAAKLRALRCSSAT
jgi:hypothetical protein